MGTVFYLDMMRMVSVPAKVWPLVRGTVMESLTRFVPSRCWASVFRSIGTSIIRRPFLVEKSTFSTGKANCSVMSMTG